VAAGVGELERLLAPERVLTREIDRLARARDASVYRLVPQAVVRPRDVAEVQALFGWARRGGRHLTFRTAGTSLSGQAVTDDVLIELGPFWRGLEVLDEGARVRVEPGVVGSRVNRALRPFGTRIGPDPASIDTAMLGGIVANNASGMCCGVAQNSYRTLDAMTCVLPDGTVVDSARPDADDRLRRDAPAFYAGLLRLRDDVRSDKALSARIRKKFATKNTTGYSLNAFLDYERAADILVHLLVGSQGTLGFIADVTLRAVPDPPARATTLALFDELARAAASVPRLAEAGADAVEILDAASLRAIRDELGAGFDPGPQSAGLLVELRREEEAALADAVAALDGLMRDAARPAEWSRDARERARLWHLRKGLAATTSARRPRGTAFLTEDVAVPVERLADAILDCQRLFARQSLPDTAIFGHAKDGNLHFVLAGDLRRPEAVARYDAFIGALVEVVGKYDGALKAEHGSGRNMAPFVRTEWGDAAWEAMWRVKRLFDPDGILSPGVVLSRDPQAHLRGLKPVPAVDESVDACIECGYCENACPSRALTLTPRQRIAVLREIAGVADPARRAALEADFAYDGVATCVGDGLCAAACPVHIDTGALMRERRGLEHGSVSHALADAASRAFGLAAAGARAGLTLGRTAGLDLPRAAGPLPAPASLRGRPRVVYFPSCLTRTLAEEAGAVSRAQAMLDVLDAAGFDVAYPAGLSGLCCGLAFESKGFADAAQRARDGTQRALQSAGQDALAVVTDASPCAAALAASGVLDFADFWAREALPRLAAPRRVPGPVVLHPACSTTRSGGIDALLQVVRAHAEDVVVPGAAGCCGFAGDRGFVRPEITESATRDEADEVARLGGARHVSTTRTCELAMTRATGRAYTSLVHLVRESLRG
jgi:D-lactate dehydrogenase